MTPPTPKPPPPPYRVLEIGAAPGTTMLEATLNTYAAQGYKFVGIIEAPSLGVCGPIIFPGESHTGRRTERRRGSGPRRLKMKPWSELHLEHGRQTGRQLHSARARGADRAR